MIKEDYVSFEVAKLLKEKGFPQIEENSSYYVTEMVYSINADKKGVHHLTHRYPAMYDINNYICAPTLQMAMKWLRKKQKINIEIHYNRYGENYRYLIIYKPVVLDDIRSLGVYFHYEEAAEAAIQYCLKNLV